MTVLAGNLVDRVGEIIPRYNMLSAGDRVGVAVSGGADSVALLHILHRLSGKLGIYLYVLHVNHGLRGSESEADESFVRDLAASLRLQIVVERAAIETGNIEQEARLARRAFFTRSLERHNLRRVALGHTRSDQAETVLFRLLRGSGLAGLAAMPMLSTNGLIRPLLTTSRSELRDWALTEGVAWREDSSNADLGFARNRLRHQILPMLARDFNPNLEAVLAGTAELAQDEEDYWFQVIEPIYRQITKRTHLGSFLQIAPLQALHPAVQRRLIRRAISDLRGNLRSIDRQHVDTILAICSSRHGHDRAIIPGVDALRSFETLLLAPPGELQNTPRHYCRELNFDVECELPFRAGFLRVNRVNQKAGNCANFKEEQQFLTEVTYLDGEALAVGAVPLFVRNWEPGDELHRSGHQRAEKIKSLFQEYRVLLWERRHWPVVMAGGEIVWVRRFGAAAKFGASEETRNPIRLVYRPADE